MKLLKYTIPIIIFTIVAIFTITIFSITSINLPSLISQDLAYFLPFTGLGLEIPFAFFVIWPLMAFLGGIIGTFLAPLLLILHKKTIGRNMVYGIEKVNKSEKFKNIFQGFFPGLMAINFSLLVSDYDVIQNLMITQWVRDIASTMPDPSTYMKLTCFLVTITFTLIISFILFSALWVFNDSGIVFSNRDNVLKKNKEKPIYAESIGGGYKYILKGYAGIGVIVAYYELVFLFFSLGIIGGHGSNFFSDFVNVYLFLFYFILLPIFTMPAIIMLDVLRDWRVKFTRKWATKLGIVDDIEIKFEKVER